MYVQAPLDSSRKLDTLRSKERLNKNDNQPRFDVKSFLFKPYICKVRVNSENQSGYSSN